MRRFRVTFVRTRMESEFIEREPPLGILYLASVVRTELLNAEVNFIDAHAERLKVDETYARVLQTDCDYLCISFLTTGTREAYRLIRRVRSSPHLQDVPIVVGGVHASALPEECLEEGADYVVVGEGDRVLIELIRNLEEGRDLSGVRGLVYRTGVGGVERTGRQFLIEDLSVLPRPAFDLAESKLYDTTIHTESGAKALPIMASRGCVFDCPFCLSTMMWRRKLRFRKVEEVMDELEYLAGTLGAHEFHFYDDDLLIEDHFARALAEAILKRGLDVRFTCLSTPRSFLRVEDATLTFLREAGLQVIEIGIESLMPEVLAHMRKSYQVDELSALVDRLIDHEIDCYPLLVYLAIGETLGGHLRQAERFTNLFGRLPYVQRHMEVRCDVFLSSGSTYTPFPGAPLANTAAKWGVVLADSWDDYDTRRISFVPNTLLDDVPVRATPLTAEARIRFRKFWDLALRFEWSDDVIESRLWTLWDQIDGKRSIRAIIDRLDRNFLQCTWNAAAAFTVLGVLTLLLNGVLAPRLAESS